MRDTELAPVTQVAENLGSFEEPIIGRDPESVTPFLPEIHGPANTTGYSREEKAVFQVAANTGDSIPQLQLTGGDAKSSGNNAEAVKPNLDGIRDNDLMNAVSKESLRPFLKEHGLPLEGPELDNFLSKVHREEMIRNYNNNHAEKLGFDVSDEKLANGIRDSIFEGTKQLGVHSKETIEGVKSDDPKIREAAWNQVSKEFAKIMEFSGNPNELYNFANPVESLKQSLGRYLDDIHQFVKQEGYERN